MKSSVQNNWHYTVIIIATFFLICPAVMLTIIETCSAVMVDYVEMGQPF